jgi:protocatechuate 3,4-dioxygenase beta subunit
MSVRNLASLLVGLLLSSSVASAQTAPPTTGDVIPGPATGRTQAPGAPPRDNANPQAPGGTSVIRGRVTAADSGNPLRRAQVRLAATDVRMIQTANTDADGRFEFIKLPAARYTINVMRSGYVTLSFGQQRPFEPGKPLNLADGEVADKIDFALPRGSVITGRITDETGEPMAGARVQAMRYQYLPTGQRQLVPGNIGGPGNPFGIVTDDLGQFRVYGLMPGTYVLSATSSMNGMMTMVSSGGSAAMMSMPGEAADANNGYVTTYYPGTANPEEAQAITVGLSQEASAYFSLIPARLSRIAGFVRTSQGQPASGLMLMLRTVVGMGNNSSGGGMTGPDGSFTLTNVAPGEHFIDVRPRPGPPMAATVSGTVPAQAEPEFATVPISVSGQDIAGLVITTTPGSTVSGRLVFDGTHPVTTNQGGSSQTRVMVEPAEIGNNAFMPPAINSFDNGVVDGAGAFQIRGVSGRVLFRTAGTPQGWFFKSVTLNGTDLTDTALEVRAGTSVTGLEVVLTDQQATLSGTVKNSRGETVKDYVLGILPDNLREGASPQRFVRTVRPDQNGQYKAIGLPAGDYVAFAVESLDQGGIFDPLYQEEMKARGKTFRLTDGQTLTLDLQLAQ